MILSTGGGVACVAGGCVGGVHGRGACVAGGCAWWGHVSQWGVCMAGGRMHGQGGTCHGRGVCVVGGMHARYYEIRSMSGRYASYWNAFLLNGAKTRDIVGMCKRSLKIPYALNVLWHVNIPSLMQTAILDLLAKWDMQIISSKISFLFDLKGKWQIYLYPFQAMSLSCRSLWI